MLRCLPACYNKWISFLFKSLTQFTNRFQGFLLDSLPCFPFEFQLQFQFVNNSLYLLLWSTMEPRLSKSSRNVGQRFTAAGMQQQRNKTYTGALSIPIANSFRMNGLLCAPRKGNCSALLKHNWKQTKSLSVFLCCSDLWDEFLFY